MITKIVLNGKDQHELFTLDNIPTNVNMLKLTKDLLKIMANAGTKSCIESGFYSCYQEKTTRVLLLLSRENNKAFTLVIKRKQQGFYSCYQEKTTRVLLLLSRENN